MDVSALLVCGFTLHLIPRIHHEKSICFHFTYFLKRCMTVVVVNLTFHYRKPGHMSLV